MALLSDFIGGAAGAETAVFQEVLAAGVNGLVFNGTSQVVPFNTEIIGQSWASLSSDQITLDAGRYRVGWRCALQAQSFEYIQVSLYDTVGAVNLGAARLVSNTNIAGPEAGLCFYVDLDASKICEVKIAAANAMSAQQSNAFNDPGDQFYEQISFTKIG